MDKPSKELIHTESESLGGVSYEIRVVREEEYLFGEWTCGQCKVSGASGVGCTEIKDAVFSAGKGLDTHHRKAHARRGADSSSGGTDAPRSDGPGLRLIRMPPAGG
jgi:hypothetical protein